MTKFVFAIEYLTGYAVATVPYSRNTPEWPPHPARVFMALAAAHFECDADDIDVAAERAALDWLSTLKPPAMTVPTVTTRDVLTVYVPVNDQKAEDALLHRSKQPRYFPRVHVGDQILHFIYEVDDEEFQVHSSVLADLCKRVTRIGHSSSLVWIRLAINNDAVATHVPDEFATSPAVRLVSSGAVARLESAYNEGAISRFMSMQSQIVAAKGTVKRQLSSQLTTEFPNGRPTSQRPSFSLSRPYREIRQQITEPTQSVFDPNFIVLCTDDAATQLFGVESTAAFAKALIGLLMGSIEKAGKSIPAWVSGHEQNGEPLRSSPHIAIIPLAFVGRHWINAERHARGQLLGLGLLVPREISLRERSRFLSEILFNDQNQPKTLDLKIGQVGDWSIVRDTNIQPKLTLRCETYTEASSSWASVTPVVLDRMPKTDRTKAPTAWREEVAEVIKFSCINANLPEPVLVRVEKTPFFIGSHRAMPGQGGFPLLRQGRFQVHVKLDFAQPVAGPVLIGAGRFRGYGLFRPWRETN